jgi:hypothetical protein
VVELGGVGGAMLLVHAELHRQVGAGNHTHGSRLLARTAIQHCINVCTGFALRT